MARGRSSSPRRSRRRGPASASVRGGGGGPGAGFWLTLLLLVVLGVGGWFVRRAWIAAAPRPEPVPVPVRAVAALPVPDDGTSTGAAATPVTPVTPTPARPGATPAAGAGGELRFVPPPPPAPPPPVADATGYPRVVANLLEAQIALARSHISSGAIDGVAGAQTAAALAAFQQDLGLPASGQLDPATRARLVIEESPIGTYLLTEADLAGLSPLAPTWLGKSQQTALAHETLLERLAERHQSHPNLLRRLNPGFEWATAGAGLPLNLPRVARRPPVAEVAHLHVRLGERILQARSADGALVAHFPVSIAKRVDKRPVGALRVTVVVPDPNYTFDPEVFPESAEARELGRKLILPPGPNNPVGVAWIGLDRPGYGIHGTPSPEQVGRTESHGCFRLANWDARALLALVRPGLPVFVEP